MSSNICKLDKYLPRNNSKCVDHIKEEYIREALDMICDTDVDTTYIISMAQDHVDDHDNDILDNPLVSCGDVDNNSKVQQFIGNLFTRETQAQVTNTSDFLKL